MFLGALIALAGVALAEGAIKVTTVTPDALTWKDNPNIPKGGQFAILLGDPTKAGDVIVQRVKFPPNYQVPPHTHPYAETVTVISGSLGFGEGEKFDNKGELLKPGAFLQTRRNTRIMLGQETRRRLSKFSSSVREASTTSIRLTTLARRRTKSLLSLS